MSDIFISYASDDRDAAGVLAKGLTDLGWSVWWDRKILTGETYDQVIERALSGAKCVVVLWSRQSIASEWVKNEATAGAERGVLIPVRVEDVTPPLEFRRKQTADLADWDGDPAHAGFQALSAGIAAVIDRGGARPARAQPAAQTRNRRWAPAAIAAGGAAVIIAAFAAGRLTKSPVDSRQSTVSQQSTGGDARLPTDDARLPTDDRRLSTDARQAASPNLLATENGGHLVAAPSDAWAVSIDGKADHESVRIGEEAVFAFNGNQPATFSRFGILITNTGRNPKEVELLAGDESPTGPFRPIGTFHPQNAKMFQTDGWQDFNFAPVTAKFLKVRLPSSFEESVWIELHEFRLLNPPL